MTCDDTRIALGAYVLDALDPAERADVDVHLRGCAECRSELAELAALPALLSRLSLQDLGESLPTTNAPDALFDKVVASVRDETGGGRIGEVLWAPLRRHPARAWLAAAAAVVLLGGGISTAVLVTGSSGSSPSVQQASGVQGKVRMNVTLASQATGTALRVAVSGLPKDEHCWLVAVGKDGSRESVGRWVATYAGEAQVTGSTSIPAGQLKQLVLFGTDDQELVTVPV